MTSVCGLNRPLLVEARRRMRRLLRELRKCEIRRQNRCSAISCPFPAICQFCLGFHPPRGNSRPEGIAASHHERRKRGELPEIY